MLFDGSFKNIVLVNFSKFLSVLIGLLVLKVLANELSLKEFGVFSHLIAISAYVVIGCLLGSSQILLSCRKNSEKFYSVVRLASISTFVVSLLSFFYFGFVYGMSLGDSLVISVCIILSTYMEIAVATLISEGRASFSQLSSLFIRQSLFLTSLLVTASFINLSLKIVLVCQMFSLMGANLVLWCGLRIEIQKLFVHNLNFAVVSDGFRFFAFSLVQAMNRSIDLVIVGYLLGFDHTAIYRIAVAFILISGFLLYSINVVTSKTINKINPSEVIQVIRKVVWVSVLMVGCYAVFLAIFLPHIIQTFFGEAYQAAYMIGIAGVAGYIMYAFFSPYAYYMQLRGLSFLLAKFALGALFLNVTTAIIFCNYIGMLGAILGTVVGMLVFGIQCKHHVIRHYSTCI